PPPSTPLRRGPRRWSATAASPTGCCPCASPLHVAPLLANRVYIDLVGLEEAEAAARRRAGVGHGRAKPVGTRHYPDGSASAGAASFPARRPAVFRDAADDDLVWWIHPRDCTQPAVDRQPP